MHYETAIMWAKHYGGFIDGDHIRFKTPDGLRKWQDHMARHDEAIEREKQSQSSRATVSGYEWRCDEWQKAIR